MSEREERERDDAGLDWLRRHGPPALDSSHHFDRGRWRATLPPPSRRRGWPSGWLLAAGAAAALLLARALPVSHATSASTPHPPAIAFSVGRSAAPRGGPPGASGGAVTRIANPRAFAATRKFPPPTTNIFEVRYYVVAGVKIHGQWIYPMSITASPGSSSWGIISFPLAVNDARHLQLDEVGVVSLPFQP